MDRLRDGGWMVDGSDGWRVDSRSPKGKKPENIKTKIEIKSDLLDQWK